MIQFITLLTFIFNNHIIILLSYISLYNLRTKLRLRLRLRILYKKFPERERDGIYPKKSIDIQKNREVFKNTKKCDPQAKYCS